MRYLIVCVVFITTATTYSCKSDTEYIAAPPATVSIVSDTISKKLSDAISYSGFKEIKGLPYTMRQIDNLIITENEYIIFDSDRSTQEKIYVVDKQSGMYKKQFFVPKRPDGELSGIRDICYDSKNKKMYALAYEQIFEYDAEGALNIIPLAVNGAHIAVTEEGHLLIETAPNSSVASNECYHLMLFDKKGRELNKLLPYKPQKKGFIAGEMGFLKQTEKGLLYCKPFGDTIYQVKGEHLHPLLTLNLEGKSVNREDAMDIDKFMGGSMSGKGYFMSDIECIDDQLVFSFLDPDEKLSIGFYNMETGVFINSRHNAEKNILSKLMSYGKVLGRDGDKFVFELKPIQAENIIKNHSKVFEKIKKIDQPLYNSILNIYNNETTGIIYFHPTKKIDP